MGASTPLCSPAIRRKGNMMAAAMASPRGMGLQPRHFTARHRPSRRMAAVAGAGTTNSSFPPRGEFCFVPFALKIGPLTRIAVVNTHHNTLKTITGLPLAPRDITILARRTRLLTHRLDRRPNTLQGHTVVTIGVVRAASGAASCLLVGVPEVASRVHNGTLRAAMAEVS